MNLYIINLMNIKFVCFFFIKKKIIINKLSTRVCVKNEGVGVGGGGESIELLHRVKGVGKERVVVWCVWRKPVGE